ncbi:DUF3899 domain-containing protein [Filibacter tadaridae]
MFLYYKQFSLLSYINSSFIVGGTITFVGLIYYVFSTGFFDFFTVSMRKVFTPKRRRDDVLSMRKPSEIFSGSSSRLVVSGVLVLIASAIALGIFYS